jgi:hypothetical protein
VFRDDGWRGARKPASLRDGGRAFPSFRLPCLTKQKKAGGLVTASPERAQARRWRPWAGRRSTRKARMASRLESSRLLRPKLVGVFPGVPLLVTPLERDIKHGAFVGILPPNAGADRAVAESVNRFVVISRSLIFHIVFQSCPDHRGVCFFALTCEKQMARWLGKRQPGAPERKAAELSSGD